MSLTKSELISLVVTATGDHLADLHEMVCGYRSDDQEPEALRIECLDKLAVRRVQGCQLVIAKFAELQPGDVLTHTFRDRRNAVVVRVRAPSDSAGFGGEFECRGHIIHGLAALRALVYRRSGMLWNLGMFFRLERTGKLLVSYRSRLVDPSNPPRKRGRPRKEKLDVSSDARSVSEA